MSWIGGVRVGISGAIRRINLSPFVWKNNENMRDIGEYLVGILLNLGTVFLKVTLGFFITLKIGMLIGLNSSEVSGFSTS